MQTALGNKTIVWLLMACLPFLLPGCEPREDTQDADSLRRGLPSKLTPELEARIPELMREAGIPGLQVALIRGGRRAGPGHASHRICPP